MSQETSIPSEPKVVWHDHTVDRLSREKLNGHRGRVIWFTGLSGSGKSTVANLVDQQLHSLGYRTFLLDGDNIRHGLCAGPQILQKNHSDEFAKRFGLGFSPEDREENIRRIGAVAELFASAGVIVLTAFVSPYRRDRDSVRKWVNDHGREGDFVEVFVDTPIEICQQRDPKGLYKLAKEGKIPHFTGVSDPYESPESPELHLTGHPSPPEKLAEQVVKYLQQTDAIKLSTG